LQFSTLSSTASLGLIDETISDQVSGEGVFMAIMAWQTDRQREHSD
jgi:hypothetical protein